MTPDEIQDAMELLRKLAPSDILFRALFAECRGEIIEAQVGVGSVIRTRAVASGRRYNDVILAPAQFSAFSPADVNFPKLLEPERYEAASVLAQLRWVAAGIVDLALRDNVKGATHYYDFSIIVGRGQQKDESRLPRYLSAVDTILGLNNYPADFFAAKDLIHTLVAPLPPTWDDEVLPVARKGHIVFFKL